MNCMRRSLDVFENIPEQAEAKRLLRAALADEGPAHAYLFHGPPGVGKRAAAVAFAGALIGDRGRVERGSHPDLYLVEPVGDQIRIDDIRELRRDLHMRPFEADRRVYLIYAAETMNEDAADALLNDLELLDLPTREAEQRVRRAARGAEREELLASLEELASWYRDLVVVAVGAERAVVHADRRDVLEQDGTTDRLAGAERSCELVRETWRAFEEFNLSPPLALEALFVRLRRELGATPALA